MLSGLLVLERQQIGQCLASHVVSQLSLMSGALCKLLPWSSAQPQGFAPKRRLLSVSTDTLALEMLSGALAVWLSAVSRKVSPFVCVCDFATYAACAFAVVGLQRPIELCFASTCP